MNDNDGKNVALNFLAGVGIGALVGASVALLLSPKSGAELREDLKKIAGDLSKSSEEMLAAAGKKAKQAYDAGKETVQKKLSQEESCEAPTPEA